MARGDAVTPDKLRPANIARAAGAVASRAADVERRADRATRTPPGSPARGDALLATDEALDATLTALRDLAALAAEELDAHPIGARAHAAAVAMSGAGVLYAGAVLARAQAWRTGAAPDADAATDQERRDAVAVAAAVARLTAELAAARAELLARREVDHWLGPANAEQRHWRTLQHLADGTLRAEDHDAGLCVEAPDYPALAAKLRELVTP
jgi:hypothetical protein